MPKMKAGKKIKPGMAVGTGKGTPALKSALTQMSPSKDGVRTVGASRNSSKGFGKKIGM